MDDILKAVAAGLAAALFFNGSLERRAARAADTQMREALHNSGRVRSVVRSRGWLGLFVNDIWSVDIYGTHQNLESLPFTLAPRRGWKGRIRHLRLHFTDMKLAGLPIERLDADIPFATFDPGRALYKNRLVLRGAGEGPGLVQVGESGLRLFVEKKYPQLIRDVRVGISAGRVSISGKLVLGTGVSALQASGSLAPRSGRYVDLTDPVVEIDGKMLDPPAASALMGTINPVLDSDRDLHLKGFFRLTGVETREGAILFHGAVTVPVGPVAAARPGAAFTEGVKSCKAPCGAPP